MKNVLNFCLGLCFLLTWTSCSDDIIPTQELDLTQELQDQHVIEKRNCGTEDHMLQLLSDPTFSASYNKRIESFRKFAAEHTVESRELCANPVILPMAVHFQDVPNPDASCLQELAEAQIAILNADYQGTNSDISIWQNSSSSSFPGLSNGEACIEFCIATLNHPSGYGLNDGDLAVTINATSGDNVSAWSGYLNIFVQFDTGVLGYSPLGGSGNGDGVVVDANAFGAGAGCGSVVPSAPYNLGRTLTHELGHYLFLDHIWGNGCGQDDGIADTPNSAEEYYGCPNVGESSCSSTDLHMNYMDYTNDACMYMFSNGQAVQMENYVSANLSNLVSNAALVCGVSDGGGDDDGGDDGDNGVDQCQNPTDAVVSEIMQTTAFISWTAIPDVVNHRLFYRKLGTSGWTKRNFTANSYTIINLDPATDYEWKIRTLCEDGWTTISDASFFTTLAEGDDGSGDDGDDGDDGDGGNDDITECQTPMDAEVTDITQTTAFISWTAIPDVINYRLLYREVGTAKWIRRNMTINSYTFINLTPDTEYEWKIRSKCEDGWTPITDSAYFTTLEDGGGDDEDDDTGCVTVDFSLTFDYYSSETSWELLDENDVQLGSGANYQNGLEGSTITEEFCLEDGCYTLYVDDSYGDGICCNYGDGSFELTDQSGDVIGFSDGNFGYYDSIEFCVENGEASFKEESKDTKAANIQLKQINSSN